MKNSHWDLENGFFDKEPYVNPFRISSSGENGGLTFEIWRNFSEVKNSSYYNKGFKLVAHLPSEVPQFDKQYYRFPLEKSATLILRPSMLITDGLENYNVKTRQCYFASEKKLRYFKSYSRPNCQMECLTNYTRLLCQCIHFSLPRLEQDSICDDEKSKQCYENAKKEMMKQNMELSLKTSESYDDRGKIACECLPACTSLNYEGEISHDDIRYFGRSRRSE